MINVTLPTIKSVGSLDTSDNTVPVVYTLVDRTGATFEFSRKVNAVLDSNNNLDQMGTSKRCFEILTGLIASCDNGSLSKAKADERIAQEAKSAAIAQQLVEASKEREAQRQAAMSTTVPVEGTAKVTETK